jgi:hypothetical protein
MKYEIREVVGYEGLYAVDNEGNVFSIKKDGLKLLKPNKPKNGYLQVMLSKFGERKYKQIHRLVLEAFMPNENSDKLTVNHKDEDKRNNNLENLEWLTLADNIRYSTAHPIVRLDKNDNLIGVYESINEAARQTNGKVANIWKCIKGINKTHKDSKWLLYEDYFKMTITNKDENLTN